MLLKVEMKLDFSQLKRTPFVFAVYISCKETRVRSYYSFFFLLEFCFGYSFRSFFFFVRGETDGMCASWRVVSCEAMSDPAWSKVPS